MHECFVQNRLKVKVNPFTLFWGPFFKVNFLENNTSNESQNKLKHFIRPKEHFLAFLTNLKNGPKSSKSSTSLGFDQPRTQALLSWFRLHYLLQKHKIKLIKKMWLPSRVISEHARRIPTTERETIRPLSHWRMSLVGFELNASDWWPNNWPMGQYRKQVEKLGSYTFLSVISGES